MCKRVRRLSAPPYFFNQVFLDFFGGLFTMSAPTLQRRRSSRIADSAHPYAKPDLKKQGSSTMGLTGALAGLATDDPPKPSRRSSDVDAATARARFMKMQDEAKSKKSAVQQVKEAKFARTVSKFESKKTAGGAGPSGSAGTSSIGAIASARGVAGKLAAFKQKEEEELGRTATIKKTWKKGPGGGYKKGTIIEGPMGQKGPAPKKSIADLP